MRTGKKGIKRSIAAGSHGLPISIVLGGAGRHDIKLLEETLKSLVTAGPKGMNMCPDAGYAGRGDWRKGWGTRRASGGRERSGRKRRIIHCMQHGGGWWRYVIRG
ncbi:MAG: hypothetical protein LBG27_03965 [Spirochaetaceae bacterium]|nr:hypothetical protein [Spirochaetaceae bacterium]